MIFIYIAIVKKIHLIAYCFLLISVMYSCAGKKTVTLHDDKSALFEADRAFSKMSDERGMKAAFIEYIDSNGVLLRPNHMPIVGAGAVDYLIQLDDSDFSLSWQPEGASISESSDLGYTYGVYALTPSHKDTVIYGTYVSIWKKQNDGKWKYVLNSGNPGIEDDQD